MTETEIFMESLRESQQMIEDRDDFDTIDTNGYNEILLYDQILINMLNKSDTVDEFLSLYKEQYDSGEIFIDMEDYIIFENGIPQITEEYTLDELKVFAIQIVTDLTDNYYMELQDINEL